MSIANEEKYLEMLSYIMEYGVEKGDRTGTGTKEVFSYHIKFDLSDGSFPIFTTKQVFWKTAFKEMLWMLSGSRNIRPLLEQNCTIWSEWPYKKYIEATNDSITMKEFEEKIINDESFALAWGDTGGAYGYQWRNWPAFEDKILFVNDRSNDVYNKGKSIDQIQQVIDKLKTNPNDRRMRFTAWNVPELDKMMLPPCHSEYQFLTGDGKLNLAITLRSWDCFLGAPFNIANGAMLLSLVALHTGFDVGELSIHAVSAHIYSNHYDQVKLQMSRKPFDAPKLIINKKDSLFDQTIDDFSIVGYTHHGKIEGEVAV